METSVQLGQRLLVVNQINECAQPCIVVFVGTRLDGRIDVAFSFTAAMPYFWRNSPTDKLDGLEVEWNCEEAADSGLCASSAGGIGVRS